MAQWPFNAYASGYKDTAAMAAMAWCISSLPQLALLTPDSSSSAIAELDHASL
jgi:hypothetical protein